MPQPNARLPGEDAVVEMLAIVVVLGIVEGLTEFLPISSTGHLILVGHWLGYRGEQAAIFEVVIQVGAILAVIWEYRRQLLGYLGTPARPASRRFYANIILAFLPAAVLGLLFHRVIQSRLFGPLPVAIALLAGAVAILVIEKLPHRAHTRSLDELSYGQSLGIGVAQCAALFPGFSRAGATILGGLVAGLDRPTATLFSFLLAIPTLVGAATLELASGSRSMSRAELGWIGLGLVVSFFAALIAIRWFLRYVSQHSLLLFAWYRIALGLLVLWFVRA
jgi:undecaprenyl-diphosphatase